MWSYHFLGTLKPFFLQIFQYAVFSIQSCHRFYFFWRSLGHSEIMWVIVLLWALHKRHLGLFLIKSIIVLMLLVPMHKSLALVIIDSISLFKWIFCNQFQDSMTNISSVSLMNWPWSLLFFQSCFLLVCCFV